MTYAGPEQFERNVDRALADDALRGALRRATDLFGERRSKAIAAVPDWEELRDQARRIKDTVLSDYDRYFQQFTGNARAQGVEVLESKDAAAACAQILEIVRASSAKEIV